MAQKFAHSLSPIPLFAPYALSLPEIRRIAILKALKVGPQDPQWHKLSQVFDDMVFHCCLFLDLGYGFRTASYPFSQTRPGESGSSLPGLEGNDFFISCYSETSI